MLTPLRLAALLCAGIGLLLGLQAAWIPAKAALAQHLLERAWQRVQAGGTEARPWSWADTRPVARIRVPRLGASWIALEGASGRTLAFGPGHLSGTPAPGEPGNSVLFGHRDTHFAALAELRIGDALEVETRSGGWRRYVVARTEVVHERDGRLLGPAGPGASWLTLITCYPFGAAGPGPLRYGVRAVAVDDALSRAPSSAMRRPSSSPLLASAGSRPDPSGP